MAVEEKTGAEEQGEDTVRLTVNCSVRRGIHKAQCEDTCLIGTKIVNDGTATVECVPPARVYICDGVGENAGGGEASMFICKHISDDFKEVNMELIRYGRESGKPQMATTLTGLIFRQDGIVLVHAGNTRLYTVRGGYLNQITTDHTTCEWLRQTGNDEAAETYNKNEIRCAFGGGSPDYLNDVVVRQIFSDRVPGMLMMTTDGIHDYLTEDQMESIIGSTLSASEKINLLIETSVNNGSEDDCSAVIIGISER